MSRSAVRGRRKVGILRLVLTKLYSLAHLRLFRVKSEEQAVNALLRDVIEMLPEAIVLMDRDDRIVLWNKQYETLYPEISHILAPGIGFREILEASLASGQQPEDVDERNAWLARRLTEHSKERVTTEQKFRDGRWVRHEQRRTTDGGTICVRVDVTDLKKREESFRLLFEANPTPMYVVDRETLGFTDVNDAALALYGYDRQTFLALTMLHTRPVRERAAFIRLVEDGSLFNYAGVQSWTHLTKAGKEITVLPYTKPLTIDGASRCLVCVVDLTERQRAEGKAKLAKDFLDTVVEAIPTGVFVKDMRDHGRYVLCNHAAEVLMDREREAIIGHLDPEIFPLPDANRFAAEDARTVREDCIQILEAEQVRRRDGEIRTILTKKLPLSHGEDGRARFVLGISEDITEQNKLTSQLDYLAHHDSLTGLPNRVVLHRRLIDSARELHRSIAIHYIDLNGFKLVNDTFGHEVGDELLRRVAGRLAKNVEAVDTVSRLGGDEFVVLQQAVSTIDDAIRLAQALLEALGEPYDIDCQHVVVSASIGIALTREGVIGTDDLLHFADVALYAAKLEGGGSYRLFEPQMDHRSGQSRKLASEFMSSLEREEFVLHYQPICDAASGALAGYEALIRWQHPVNGLLQPSSFIPVAEELGMIGALGRWVVRQACLEAVSWSNPCIVAVNLSPAEFSEPSLLASIGEALTQSGLDPARLELEITETVLMKDTDRNLSILHSLRAMGVKIALDDFGMGYSSLSLAQHLPVDRIKIDRSFTAGLPLDRGSLAVVRAVVALAKCLGIETTAEGVETELQMNCLKSERCDAVQGYLIGRPMEVTHLRNYVVAEAS